MRLFLILTFLTTSAFAQKQTLKDMLDVIANPKSLNEPVCEMNNNPVNACQSLSGAVCAIRNDQKGLKELQKKYGNRLVPSLEVIQKIENEVFAKSFVKHDDLVKLFEEVRSMMVELISKNSSLTADQSEAMKKKIKTVKFMSGPEYIQFKTTSSGKVKGLRNYNENCGIGTEVSAFNQQDVVVLCPGLIQSLQDFGVKSKQEMLNSLSFTMGHELAHSIDSTADRFPNPYERMRGCYDEFETRGPEISSDFWGAQVFAERLKSDNITGTHALRVLAMATDDFCSFPEDQYYPSGQARLDVTIGREPALREILGCGGPTFEAPVCTLEGNVPVKNAVAEVK